MFNKYQVIKGALNYELANFIFNYFLLKRDAVDYMYKNNMHIVRTVENLFILKFMYFFSSICLLT